MTLFELRTSQLLPRPRAEVFAFFGAAENLEVLTPPWLGFNILTPLPLAMGKGTLLDYRIRLHGRSRNLSGRCKNLCGHLQSPSGSFRNLSAEFQNLSGSFQNSSGSFRNTWKVCLKVIY